MKTVYLITSAINTRFGVYNTEQRIVQTIKTIESIRKADPHAYIILIEMGGVTMPDEQKALLQSRVNSVVDYSHDQIVKDIYKNDNWDVVKSSTELLCFGTTLKALKDKFKDYDRFVKVSGRYELTEDFDLSAHNTDKIVFAKHRKSQFVPTVTEGRNYQYMSRCWSFPKSELNYIADLFPEMLKDMLDIVNRGGYLDIEHLLYDAIDKDKVKEVEKIGVTGNIGPNGVKVDD
jgi:hypothetical protein